ncbi:MAG TPA: DUF4199 domain-containing protein [Candidatus Acidoferrum sp.]
MKKTVLIFGLISGAISAAAMLATLPFLEKMGGNKGYVVGYTIIILSALMVFFGVRSYRENVAGGRLTFGRGFAVGILIALISSVCYVATWEVIYFKFMPDFSDKYAAHMVEKAKAAGASPQKIEETERKAAQFKEMYNNPLINVAMTFAEPFPIGLVVTLLSAAILPKKQPAPAS